MAEHLKRIEFAIDRHSLVSITDPQGAIIYVNPRFCDISGYSPDELLGANHRIFKSGVSEPEVYQEMWRVISSGDTWRGELCNRRKDGSHYWVDTAITPLLDEQGGHLSYIAVSADITPLKELQSQIMVAMDEAVAASQAKSIFLAHMSHELKTPLNSVMGFSQLLRYDPQHPLNDNQTEMLAAIERNGRHLLELIDDLVDLAKIESGHLGLLMEAVAISPMIQDCLILLKPQAQQRKIELAVDASSESVHVQADRIRVKQVLLNLLALAQWTDYAILRSEAAHRPVIGSDPRAKLFFMLKGFLYSYYTMMKRIWTQMGHQQNFMTAMPLLSAGVFSMGLAALGYGLRKELAEDVIPSAFGVQHGGYKTPDDWEYLSEMIDRSGMLGPFAILHDMWNAEKRGQMALTTFMGPAFSKTMDFYDKDLPTFVANSIPIVAQSSVLRHSVGSELNKHLPKEIIGPRGLIGSDSP